MNSSGPISLPTGTGKKETMTTVESGRISLIGIECGAVHLKWKQCCTFRENKATEPSL